MTNVVALAKTPVAVARNGPYQTAVVRAGQVLAGKYRVDRVLGAGGMGVVVAAHHLPLDVPVAIKLLLPAMLEDRVAVARFTREARAAIRLNSEHVTRVFDVGTLPDGVPYLVMEYLDGEDLGSLLRRQGRFPIAEAADLLLQACEAMAEAHALDIVHRDLKPGNLFCVRRPDGRTVVKVLDFGISKAASPGAAPDKTLTLDASLVGTPLYMSPEQLESSGDVDARTDVWSLGVILYELVTGAVPFSGATLPEVTVKIAIRPQPPLHEARPDAPDGLAAVIDRCLEKDRERRFASVADLAVALLPFCSASGRTSVERIAGATSSARTWSWAPTSSSAADAVPPSARPSTRASAWESAIDPAERMDGPAEEPPSDRAPAFPARTMPSPIAPRAIVRSTPSEAIVLARSADPAEDPSWRPPRDPDAIVPVSPRGQAVWGFLFAAATLGIAAVTGFAILSGRPPLAALPAVGAAAGPTTLDPGPASRPGTAAPPEPAPAPEPPAVTPALGPVSTKSAVARLDHAPAPPAASVAQPVRATASAPRARPASAEPQATSPAAAARPRADCDPSFYLDEQGRKHFKPECFAPGSAVGSTPATANAKADCDPSYTLDEQGRKHFKPQCFLDSSR